MVRWQRTIGVIGGMGPAATARFYLDIVEHCQTRFGAVADSDYPEIVIHNVPIAEVVTENADTHADAVCAALIDSARRLEAFGAGLIVIPCNTVHVQIPSLRAAVNVPVIDMVRATVERVRGEYARVGVLGTASTLASGLYQDPLRAAGIDVVVPHSPPAVTALIVRILAGESSASLARALGTEIEALAQRGAEAVILGCTDLPLVVDRDCAPVPLVDTLAVLAETAVAVAQVPRTEDRYRIPNRASR